ncbi:MAG: molecular chaperone HtpG, partial [Dokdonia sp.]
KIKETQTDKDGKMVVLYASDVDAQHSYIQSAKDKGYEVLLLNTPIVPHLIQKLETSKENVTFVRVDGDHIDNLIKKEETQISKLSDEETESVKESITTGIADSSYTVQMEAMDSDSAPFIITQPEFMRRMKEMQQTGGGPTMFGNMPEMYNLVVNANHALVSEIMNTKTDKKKERLIRQSFDLAKLSQNLLKGEAMTDFIKRSYEMIK